MVSSEADVSVLPAVPVHALSPRHSIETFDPISRRQTETTELPRSASSTDVTRDGAAVTNGLKRTYSENILSLPPDLTAKANGTGYVANRELFRRASRKAKNKLSTAKFSLPSDEHGAPTRTGAGQPALEASEPVKGPSRSVTGTLRSMARKSFLSSTSRSPSPAPSEGGPSRMGKKRSRSPFKNNSIAVTEIISVPAAVHSRNTSRSSQTTPEELTKREISEATKAANAEAGHPPRPTSSMLSRNKSETDLRPRRTSSILSLRSRSSMEQFHTHLSSTNVPPMPPSISTDGLSNTSFDTGKKKDPLWTAFRALDGDYVK